MSKKNFFIPKIESDEKKPIENNTFVSPFFGNKNKDEIVVPKSPLQKNIKKRYQDFEKDRKEKDKDELTKEFNLLDSNEVLGMISKDRPNDTEEHYTKVVQSKPVIKEEPVTQDITIPFGLESEIPEPISDDELNQMFGDYDLDETDVRVNLSDTNEPAEIVIDDEDEREVEHEYYQASLDDWYETQSDVEFDDEEEEDEIQVDFVTSEVIEDKPDDKYKEEPVEEDTLEMDEEFYPEESDSDSDDHFVEEEVYQTKVPKPEPKPEPKKPKVSYADFRLPPLSLLKRMDAKGDDASESIQIQEEIINNTLTQFRVGGKVVNYTHGPTVTQFEIKLDEGVMINKVTNILNNIKMNLAAIDIRMEAPIPGKPTIGLEVPNETREVVNYGNLIDQEFVEHSKELEVILGVNLGGDTITSNIAKMPHGLIAGATGSGKSVCIDTILISLLLKASPEDLKLILIDPKRVGLAAYSKIPHLASPIIYDAKVASEALKWAVIEMERRYDLMFNIQARDIDSYNEKIKGREDEGFEKVPKLVIVIEEMADLMAQASADVELSVSRIAQKARAAGIHMLIATQRPSVDVIKGTIKSNIPTRIALKVSSNTDSMTIIDYGGAESLLGNGDMLYSFSGNPLARLQGAYVSDTEIDAVTEYLSKYPSDYIFNTEKLEKKAEHSEMMSEFDPLFLQVAEFVIETDYASINRIQKQFNIGYNRASDIFETLTGEGIVSSPSSTTPRKVVMTMAEFKARYYG